MATTFCLRGATQLTARRTFCVVLLCSIALGLFALFWFASQLQAVDNTPTALGSIAGVVQDTNGQPVSGVQISLFSNYPYNSWYEQRRVTTEADGAYRFTALPVGIYRVGMDRPQAGYAPRFYPATSYIQQANDIAVIGNQATEINLTLQPGSRIIVALTATQELTVTYSYVDLRRRNETQTGIQWDSVSYYNVQTANGVYTLTGLAADTYRICAVGYGVDFAAYECYDNVYSVEKATDFVLAAGATISNVTIVLGDGANYGQINGLVTANDGNPLAGINVYAISVVDVNAAVATDQQARTTDVSSWVQRDGALPAAGDLYYGYTFTRTNALGEYQLPTLVAGKYKLQFTDPDGNYITEYYNDTFFEGAAAVFEVGDRQVISNVNIQLAPGGHISGIVTVQGQPAPNGQVFAERKIGDNGWLAVANAGINPNTGAYTIGSLPEGSYRVSAQAWIYDQQSSYFQLYGVYGGATLDEAVEIPVAAGGNVANMNIALSSPRFDGSISGRVTGQGAPLVGAKVGLYRNSSCCYQEPLLPLVYVFTDAEGRYTINGLTDSSFRLGVIDPTGLYATTYYTNKIALDFSQPIYIQDNQALTDLNFDLPVAGSISGEVKRRNGKPVTGLLVFLYTADSSSFYTTLLPTDVRTDAAGRYTIPGLHAGSYYVCFTDSYYSGYGECYGAPEWAYSIYNGAAAVKVTAGQTTANIDLIWGPDLHSYLPFVAQ